ncbi:hypothetical protein SLA2020_465140 [Shorea laevis]
METHFLILPPFPTASLPLLFLTPYAINFNKSKSNTVARCGPPGGRFRFDPIDDEPYSDDEFRFAGTKKKQRVWWSDYDDDDEDWWEFEEDDEFWIFKVFKAFTWMLPAIAISLFLGNGPDAFLMALAVPLAQSALSLVFDKVWGRTSDSWRPTPKTKQRKKPFAPASNNVKTSRGREEENTTDGEASYQSWVGRASGFRNSGAKRATKYGGWDQLDMQMGTQKKASNPKANWVPKQQMMSKLSRTGRVREVPLLVRLLVAIFPFLSSWTKIL